MSIDEFTGTLNEWGSQRIPFLFLVDFEMKKPLAFRLSEVDPEKLMYNFNGVTNAPAQEVSRHAFEFQKFPLSLAAFGNKFSEVMRHLEYGDSYLTNLTVRTALDINLPLSTLFHISRARYKLRMDDSFLVFSPEIFVQIRNGSIFSYPMKGTIDAAVPQAREKILHDMKELAEHVTIVDLIRNDLSRVARNVRVTRFRYIDEIRTNGKVLLQVSSEITGEMEKNYLDQLGSLVVNLLPAGSVSGAPKARTVEIIRHAEGEDRGYYTGVAGIFDGQNFDSGVMIRFIEQQDGRMYYRSGGGITTQSELEKEYQEVIDKIYVPLD